MKKVKKAVLEWGVTLVAAALMFLMARQFVLRNAMVNGPSMEPTLHEGDRLLIGKFFYWFGKPGLGDIIAFPYQENPSDYYVKRIVGLPGDVIEIIDRRLYINSQPLSDAFSGEPLTSISDIEYPYIVPPDSYFVMGDNRNFSKDSRFSAVGCVLRGDIVGRVFVRYYPFKKINVF